MTINIDSSEQSRTRLQLQPTPGAQAPLRPASGRGTASLDLLGLRSASPDPWVCASPRPASGGGLRLARPRGRGLHLARPLGLRSTSLDPKAIGSTSLDPHVCAPPRSASGGGLRLTRPLGLPPSCPTLGFALRLAQPLGEDSASPDPEVTGSASPDEDPYRCQLLQVQAYGPKSKL